MFFWLDVLRDRIRAGKDAEINKSFFQHLEDLRSTIFWIVVTLVVSFAICWWFRAPLMEVMKRPIYAVLDSKISQQLPKQIDLNTWKEVDSNYQAILPLNKEQRAFYLSQLDTESSHLLEARVHYLAILSLDIEQQNHYLANSPSLKPQVVEILKSWIEHGMEEKGFVDLFKKQGNFGDNAVMGAFKPTETFMLSIKLAFFEAFVLSLPITLYLILRFVIPGMQKREKDILFKSIFVSLFLFVAGVCLSYFVVLPRVLEFFFNMGDSIGVTNEWRIGYYLGFAAKFVLAFGLTFQLPVVVMALVYLDVISYYTMLRSTRYVIAGIVVLSALVMPGGEVISLLSLAVPLFLLYALCILFAFIYQKKKEKQMAKEDLEWHKMQEEYEREHDRQVKLELQELEEQEYQESKRNKGIPANEEDESSLDDEEVDENNN